MPPAAWFDPTLPLEILLLLVAVALVAGFVDAIAGGGGLLTVPALLLAGLSPVEAVATNKLQGTFGVASAAHTFWSKGQIERRWLLPLGGAAFAGGVVGALVAHLAPIGILRLLIPFVLIAIAGLMLAVPRFGLEPRRALVSPMVFGLGFGSVVGLYDGVFGPGAGTFYLMGLVMLAGFALVPAVAHTKLMNVASNLGALLFFLASGHVQVVAGLAMGIAAATGAAMGARATLRFGAGLVRPLVVLVALAMAARLLADPAHPVGAAIRALGGATGP